jgi:hypothetical protein
VPSRASQTGGASRRRTLRLAARDDGDPSMMVTTTNRGRSAPPLDLVPLLGLLVEHGLMGVGGGRSWTPSVAGRSFAPWWRRSTSHPSPSPPTVTTLTGSAFCGGRDSPVAVVVCLGGLPPYDAVTLVAGDPSLQGCAPT